MEKLEFKNPTWGEHEYDPKKVQAELGKMRAEAFNSDHGNLPGPDCPVCNKKGVVGIAREDGSMFTVPCRCLPVRTYIRKMETSGLRDVLNRFTFDTYQDSEDWQKKLKQKVKGYLDNPSSWLLVSGQSGSGKTHLCTAVCNELLRRGENVVYMPWREEVEKLKDYTKSGEDRARMKATFMAAPVLYIDDLYKCGRSADGTYTPSGTDVGIAFDIINYRWAKYLPTIISTEMSVEELVVIDEATGSRIAERADGYRFHIAKKPGRNYRLRNGEDI